MAVMFMRARRFAAQLLRSHIQDVEQRRERDRDQREREAEHQLLRGLDRIYWRTLLRKMRRAFGAWLKAHTAGRTAAAPAVDAALLEQLRQAVEMHERHQVSTRILGRRTAPFTPFSYSLPRPAWFYPRS